MNKEGVFLWRNFQNIVFIVCGVAAKVYRLLGVILTIMANITVKDCGALGVGWK
jgi:hypothetical protein